MVLGLTHIWLVLGLFLLLLLPGCIGEAGCEDGTPVGRCSSSLPGFCNGGRQLIDNCSACGCQKGTLCNDDGRCIGLLEAGPKRVIKQLKLNRTLIRRDLPDTPEELDNRTFIPKELLPANVTSHYQVFVTPGDPEVQKIAASASSNEAAYETAVGWVWVSEQTLNGVDEKWLKPHEFLAETPQYPTNPAKGRAASDCESQAYTLVSVLRARGVAPENVRVVLGLVNFSDQTGGHAWVQVYDKGEWLELDPTTGPYYDDEEQKVVESDGVPFRYFARHDYPVLQTWKYFNDAYYWDVKKQEGNAPGSWKTKTGGSRAAVLD